MPCLHTTSKVRHFFVNFHAYIHVLESIVILSVGQALLFFKYYDPSTRVVSCVAHSVESIEKRFCKSGIVLITVITFYLYISITYSE